MRLTEASVEGWIEKVSREAVGTNVWQIATLTVLDGITLGCNHDFKIITLSIKNNIFYTIIMILQFKNIIFILLK